MAQLKIKLPSIKRKRLSSISKDHPYVLHFVNSTKIDQKIEEEDENSSYSSQTTNSYNSDQEKTDNTKTKKIDAAINKFVHAYKFSQKKGVGLIDNEKIDQIKQEQIEQQAQNYKWRDASYWKLPENVRKAVDNANAQSNSTDFEKKLGILNDKITIYHDAFYYKKPKYENNFQQRKIYEQQLEKKKNMKQLKERLKLRLASTFVVTEHNIKNNPENNVDRLLSAQRKEHSKQDRIDWVTKQNHLRQNQFLLNERIKHLSKSPKRNQRNNLDLDVTEKQQSEKPRKIRHKLSTSSKIDKKTSDILSNAKLRFQMNQISMDKDYERHVLTSVPSCNSIGSNKYLQHRRNNKMYSLTTDNRESRISLTKVDSLEHSIDPINSERARTKYNTDIYNHKMIIKNNIPDYTQNFIKVHGQSNAPTPSRHRIKVMRNILINSHSQNSNKFSTHSGSDKNLKHVKSKSNMISPRAPLLNFDQNLNSRNHVFQDVIKRAKKYKLPVYNNNRTPNTYDM